MAFLTQLRDYHADQPRISYVHVLGLGAAMLCLVLLNYVPWG